MEITYRGVVYPAQTDAMGHMTVQYYVAAFDQAFWHLIHLLGYNADWRLERKEGWADVRYEIDYRAELKVGDLFKVASSIIKVGNASIVTQHKMFNAGDELCAEIQMTSVYFDLEQRTSKAIPNAIKEAAMVRI